MLASTEHPIFTEMRKMASFQLEHQVLYFAFESGGIYGPYTYKNYKHSESYMISDFQELYKSHQKTSGIHSYKVGQVFVYTVNSPCDDPGHECGNLLLNMPAHFPVNHFFHLGFSRVWDGIPTHHTEKERAEILERSKAVLKKFADSEKWSVRHVK